MGISWLDRERLDGLALLEAIREGQVLVTDLPLVEPQEPITGNGIGQKENGSQGLKTPAKANGGNSPLNRLLAPLEIEDLENALGELSGSKSDIWTAFLRMKKPQLIDRLLGYEQLRLVTLGIFLVDRKPKNNPRAGLLQNYRAITNKVLLRQRLVEWHPTELADFCYQIEITISTKHETMEDIEAYLRAIIDYLPGRKQRQLILDGEYCKKICRWIKKGLDKREADSVLWLLVKDR